MSGKSKIPPDYKKTEIGIVPEDWDPKDEEIKFKIPNEWYKKPPNIENIPEGIFIIQADAAFKDGISGTAVIIKTRGKEYTPQAYSARNIGPIHAELTSIKKGLQRLKNIRKNIKYVIVYNDNLSGYYFLTERWDGKRKYIKRVLEDIRKLVDEFNGKVEFIWVKGKHNRRVDRIAAKKRKKEKIKKEKQIQERVMKVEQAIVRGRDVQIYEKNGHYFAMTKKGGFPPGYKVSLDSLSCECPWWQKNWGNKPEYIQKARALPCKHMCALAEYLKIDIFEVFKKQIWRVD